jgi:menaquinol-cytochrome c reductase iron-sulfur subunit
MNLTRQLMNRDAFMGIFILSVGGIATVIFGPPIAAYLLSPLINQPSNVWRDVGAVSSFKLGETVSVIFDYPGQLSWAGPTKQTKAWLQRRPSGDFVAYAVYCTHLGCPVQWLPTPRLFICPCHGSVFNGDGTVAGGPAPRPLFTYPVRVVNGRVQILTGQQPLTT